MLGYLSLDIICSSKFSLPLATLSKNCSLLGTDNVRGQISWHIFAPNGGYCLYIFAPNGDYCLYNHATLLDGRFLPHHFVPAISFQRFQTNLVHILLYLREVAIFQYLPGHSLRGHCFRWGWPCKIDAALFGCWRFAYEDIRHFRGRI